MVPFSTSHFSWPMLTQPLRSLPLNSETQSSPGAFTLDCASNAAARISGIIFSGYAEVAADGCGDALGVVVDAIELRTLHHHASQWLSAGKAHQHAAGIAELGLRAADLRVGARQIRQRALFFHGYVYQFLWIDLEAGSEIVEILARGAHYLQHTKGGEQAVPGSRVIQKNDVSALLAAERRLPPDHLLEHVFVADRSPHQADAVAL